MKTLVSLFVVFLSFAAFADGDYKHMKSKKKPVVSTSSQKVVTLSHNELKSYKSNTKATNFYKGGSSTTKSSIVTNTAKQRGYKHQF
ncbi:MAG: hypothetical protein U0U66_06000 [Cytophagaceae bacterium]